MTRERARDDVLGRLREAILSGRIRPGERLPGERQLCERLGVGRPTLREALRSLEATGLIVVRPGKGGGSYPATPSEAIVGDAVGGDRRRRRGGAGEPARRLARADVRWHETLARTTGNRLRAG